MTAKTTPYLLGNTEGQYFTQWRVEALVELLDYVANGFCGIGSGVSVENAKIWYDAREDYHRLAFASNGHAVEVRLYKVFSSAIDGREGWVGCPQSQIVDFAGHLRKAVKVNEEQEASQP